MARASCTTIFLLLVVSNVLSFVHSARLLDEVEHQPQVVPGGIPQSNPGASTVPSASTTAPQQPSGQIPAVGPKSSPDDDSEDTNSDDDVPVPPDATTTNANGPGSIVGSGGGAKNIAGGSSTIAGAGVPNPTISGQGGPGGLHEPDDADKPGGLGGSGGQGNGVGGQGGPGGLHEPDDADKPGGLGGSGGQGNGVGGQGGPGGLHEPDDADKPGGLGGSGGQGNGVGGQGGPGGLHEPDDADKPGGLGGLGGQGNGVGGPGGLGGPGGPGKPGEHEPTLAFFMHDVLGGSHPSVRVVTGIIAQTEINGIPFSKANNNIFPVDNGIPLVNVNNINKIINTNTAPLLTGLNGAQPNTIIQNTNGNNNNALNGNNLPFVTAGQLPPGAALQQLLFGTITVVDDELTEAHELGSAVIGRAQGFYLASSLDGTSQTLALTVLFHGDDKKDHPDTVDDAISFFGVHRTAGLASQIAVVGGTGKYEHAKGYAMVETLHNQENQHVTDGADTILHFSVYINYRA